MDRLHRKQYLSRKMVGKAYLYEATSTRSAYTARLMREALATNPDRQGALIHFVDEMSADEVQALRRAVSRARARDQER
jgi:predicted transcriptional regulator